MKSKTKKEKKTKKIDPIMEYWFLDKPPNHRTCDKCCSCKWCGENLLIARCKKYGAETYAMAICDSFEEKGE
jgi:hypothetical protein